MGRSKEGRRGSIGRTVAVVLLLVVAGVAGTGGTGAEPAPGPDALPEVGRPTYTEITTVAGLGGFLHAGWLGSGDPFGPVALFPETMGAGVCWLDADGDGSMDLFLVNGRYLTDRGKNDELDPRSALYRNLGDGTFEEVSSATGTDLSGTYQGCAAADYDNDGDQDLIVPGYRGNVLLQNRGDGTFANATEDAGVLDATCGDFPCWGTSASWLDADLDGCLDLFVNHFTDYDLQDPREFNDPGPGQVNSFFRNRCDGTFEEITEAVGLAGEASDSWSSVAADYNGDGWPDLYVSNDGDENDLYLNDGDGTFTRVASAASDPRAGMGTAIGDLDHDGCWDIVTTNFRSETNGIYVCQGQDYEDIGDREPFTDADDYSGWGTHIWDLNHDGHQDLLVVNSMTEDTGVVPVEQPILLYENIDGETFRSIREDVGPDLQGQWVARGAAWADIDNDGDLDIQVTEGGENPTHLFRADGTAGTFLSLDLVSHEPGVTRDAIGARVTVTADGVPDQHREKVAGSSYLASNDPRLHVGLGHAATATVNVTWPGGATQTFEQVPANAFLRLTQGASAPEVVHQLPLPAIEGPSTGAYMVPLTFSAQATAAPGTSVETITWEVDGEPVDAGPALVHAFDDVGTFVVRATATDDRGVQAIQATTVHITGDLTAEVLFEKAHYLPHENVVGEVLVTFSDGAPVRGAEVNLTLTRSTGNTVADELVGSLPRFLRDLLGDGERYIQGVTDTQGRITFEVPRNLETPGAAPGGDLHHVGHYEVVALGGARGSTFPAATGGYDVVASLPGEDLDPGALLAPGSPWPTQPLSSAETVETPRGLGS